MSKSVVGPTRAGDARNGRGKARSVIQYRTFRNTDPPRLVEVWNASLANRRTVAIPTRQTVLLECFTLAKPYFDPNGLLFAVADDQIVGFVHAGFAGNSQGSALDTSVGVICSLGVVPSHRCQGIGSELLRRAEDYLRARGVREILAGPLAPANPFTFGLAGGCDSPGFLVSDPLAQPFLEHRGYTVARTCGLFQRSLRRLSLPPDPRFASLQPLFDIRGGPAARTTWWQECVLGPVEAVEYRMESKDSSTLAARAVLWDMATFGYVWGESCVGLVSLEVEPSLRQQGLAKFLLSQILLHLHQQTFDVFEVRADLDNAPALGLLSGLGFDQVETGHSFRRAVSSN